MCVTVRAICRNLEYLSFSGFRVVIVSYSGFRIILCVCDAARPGPRPRICWARAPSAESCPLRIATSWCDSASDKLVRQSRIYWGHYDKFDGFLHYLSVFC
jgi:hypothetical protein